MHLLLQMLCVDLSHMTLLQGLLLFDPFARIILLQGLGWDTVPFSRGILLQGLGWDIPFSRGILLQGLGPVTYPFFKGYPWGFGHLPFFKGYPFARIGARHLPFFKGCHVRAIPFFKGFAEHPFARAGSSLKDCNLWWTASLHLQRMQTWSFLASMHGSLWVSGCHRFWHPMSPALARCPLNHQRPPGSPTLWHTLPCPPPQCDWCRFPHQWSWSMRSGSLSQISFSTLGTCLAPQKESTCTSTPLSRSFCRAMRSWTSTVSWGPFFRQWCQSTNTAKGSDWASGDCFFSDPFSRAAVPFPFARDFACLLVAVFDSRTATFLATFPFSRNCPFSRAVASSFSRGFFSPFSRGAALLLLAPVPFSRGVPVSSLGPSFPFLRLLVSLSFSSWNLASFCPFARASPFSRGVPFARALFLFPFSRGFPFARASSPFSRGLPVDITTLLACLAALLACLAQEVVPPPVFLLPLEFLQGSSSSHSSSSSSSSMSTSSFSFFLLIAARLRTKNGCRQDMFMCLVCLF